MVTTIEYALMAGASYRSNRSVENRFPVPDGWTGGLIVPPTSSGFEATRFIKGNDIVISYAGTDFSWLWCNALRLLTPYRIKDAMLANR